MCTLGIPLNVSITSNAARQFRQPNHAKSALDVVVRLVVVAIVGFVVRLVVDLSVGVDLEVNLVVLLVVSWVVFSCFVLLVVVVVVVCPMPNRVSLFTYWICWTGVSLWATTVTDGARIPVQ